MLAIFPLPSLSKLGFVCSNRVLELASKPGILQRLLACACPPHCFPGAPDFGPEGLEPVHRCLLAPQPAPGSVGLLLRGVDSSAPLGMWY